MNDLYKRIFDEMDAERTARSNRNRNDKVLIIDGLNTFIRSWSKNPAMNEDGDHVGGIVGSLNSIAYQIREFGATRCIVVFDGKGGSNVRKKIYEKYKSNRGTNRFRVNRQYTNMLTEDEESESMKQQFVWLNDVIDYLPVKTMIYDGIEADDVIAYLTNHITTNMNGKIIIVSTDKDFIQLVSDSVTVYSPTKKKMYDRTSVYEEFGIWPQNILLYRTLDGDKLDNISGIKGCGLKTLQKRFPELSNDVLITFEDFFNLCESKRGDIKLYDTILSQRDTIYTHKRLMELSEPHIPVSHKLKILDRFNEPDNEFQKMSFFKVCQKYKILQNWVDINGWVISSFSNLITK